MKKINFFPKILPYSICTLFLAGAYFVNVNNEKPAMFISKQDQSINFNSSLFSYFNLGLKRFISSTLWVSTILESDIDHYKQKDLNSWMFLRFKTISDIEPNFYENYAFGGIYLSIVKDDINGASIIFNKGLNLFPEDYTLLRDSSYHFYYEAKNYKRAYEITQVFKKKYPDKFNLMGMTTKLEAENGKLEDALSTLTEFQNRYPRGGIIGDKIYLNRYAIRAEIDLKCLNQKQNDKCTRYDLNGDPYLKTNSGYVAQQEWKPYRRK